MNLARRHLLNGAIALLTILVLASVSGCGGSDESSAASSPLSKAEFIKKAEAVCRREDGAKTRRVERILSRRKLGTPSKSEAGEVIAEAVFPLYHELISELAALEPPAKDQAQVNRLIATFKSVLKKAERNPSYLIEHNPFIKADEMASDLGIEGCSF